MAVMATKISSERKRLLTFNKQCFEQPNNKKRSCKSNIKLSQTQSWITQN